MTKKSKIILNAVLTILLLVVMFTQFVFYGNPISKILADKAADKYLKTHYTELELERDKVYYNFNDGTYVVRLWDKNSIDTMFSLKFDSFGKMKYDTYNERFFNTFFRYVNFLDHLGYEIAKDCGLGFELWLNPDDDVDCRAYLTLDQEFDADNLPSKITADFQTYAEKPSLDDLMNGLKKVYEALKKRDIAVSSYSGLVIPNADKKENGKAETWKNAISVNAVPEEVIVDGDMDALRRLLDEGNKILHK